jgi:hypothetical protein
VASTWLEITQHRVEDDDPTLLARFADMSYGYVRSELSRDEYLAVLACRGSGGRLAVALFTEMNDDTRGSVTTYAVATPNPYREWFQLFCRRPDDGPVLIALAYGFNAAEAAVIVRMWPRDTRKVDHLLDKFRQHASTIGRPCVSFIPNGV